MNKKSNIRILILIILVVLIVVEIFYLMSIRHTQDSICQGIEKNKDSYSNYVFSSKEIEPGYISCCHTEYNKEHLGILRCRQYKKD